MSTPTRRRVYLIITRQEAGQPQLLVFTHSDPRFWTGVQTPGGTMEPGEDAFTAAYREALEETGLCRFGPARLLAEDTHETPNEILERAFVHLPVDEPTATRWTHQVAGSGADAGIDFACRWIDLPAADELDDHYRAYLDRLELVASGDGGAPHNDSHATVHHPHGKDRGGAG